MLPWLHLQQFDLRDSVAELGTAGEMRGASKVLYRVKRGLECALIDWNAGLLDEMLGMRSFHARAK